MAVIPGFDFVSVDRDEDDKTVVSMSPAHVARVVTPFGTITGPDLAIVLKDFFRHKPTRMELIRYRWRDLWPCYTGYRSGTCARGGIGCPRPHPVVRVKKALGLWK